MNWTPNRIHNRIQGSAGELEDEAERNGANIVAPYTFTRQLAFGKNTSESCTFTARVLSFVNADGFFWKTMSIMFVFFCFLLVIYFSIKERDVERRFMEQMREKQSN